MISPDAGDARKGLPVRFEYLYPFDKRLLDYQGNPQAYMNNLFFAVFIGVTSCNEYGVTELEVHRVEHIEITPIRDVALPSNRNR